MLNHLSPDFGSNFGIVECPVLLQTVKTGANMPGDGAEFVVF